MRVTQPLNKTMMEYAELLWARVLRWERTKRQLHREPTGLRSPKYAFDLEVEQT